MPGHEPIQDPPRPDTPPEIPPQEPPPGDASPPAEIPLLDGTRSLAGPFSFQNTLVRARGLPGTASA